MAIILMCIFAFTVYAKKTKSDTREVDVYNVVKEAYLTNNGFTSELSKHMSKEMFERINLYCIYNINSTDSKKLYKIDFSLKEDSQKKNNDIIYVKMIYSFKMTDLKDNTVGASRDIPVTFTIKKTGDDWYIVQKYEPA